jgi:hypothetical protein
MAIGHKISKNDDSADVNQTLYRSMIDNLQYVVHRRPNIVLAVGIVTRFCTNPKENHMMVVKRILRYLKGIEDYGLHYKNNDKLELKVYIDIDWARNVDDRNSTSGQDLFIGKRLVSWTSKKKKYISQSIEEAKYLVAEVNHSNILWIKQLLKGMKEEITKLVVIFYDNISAINISKNPIMHSKNKHISIKYHYLRELVQDKQVRLEYMNTKEHIADIFTKVLRKSTHEYLSGKMGVIPLNEVT